MANSSSESAPSVWLVGLGILVAAVGWMVSYNSQQASLGPSSLGSGLVAAGAGMFFLGLVLELFSIGSSLRRIAALLENGGVASSAADPADDGPRLPIGWMDVPKE